MKTLFLILLFTAQFLWANGQEQIDNYHVDVQINQDGSLNIKEEIAYNFSSLEKHGIYRDIPHTIKTDFNDFPVDIGLDNFTVTMDGNFVKVEQSKINGDSGSNIRLQIGDANGYVTGIHTYTIAYTVAHGVLKKGNDDAVRWNAIGTGWDIPIKSATVVVHLPNSLFQNSVNITTFSGSYGITTSNAFLKWINHKTLQSTIINLAPHEGLTVEVAFALGSLEQSGELTPQKELGLWLQKFWHWLFLGGFWFYIHRYWIKFGKNAPIQAIAVQYEAPKDMDILQAGLIYDQYADNKEFSPAIVELAQLGYLNIIDSEETLKLEKIEKDTNSLSFTQKYLIHTLFFKTNKTYEFSNKSIQKANALNDGFTKINEKLYAWSKKEGYLKQNPNEARRAFFWRIMPLTTLFMVIGFVMGASILGWEVMFMIGFFSIFIVVGLGVAIFTEGIFPVVFGILFLIIPVIMLLTIFPSNQLTLLGYTFLSTLPILGVLSYFYYKNMGAYTEKGALTYAHLEGYKIFIKRVKADEIERRLEREPNFLDKTLPYAILFGYTKKWVNLYQELHLATPIWYQGNNINHLNNLTNTIHSATTLPNSASSSGGYSGGGSSSGGGGGGGGGDSW